MASIDNCTTYHYCIDGLRPRWRLVRGIGCGFNYNLIHRFSNRDILVNDRNTLIKRVGVEMSENKNWKVEFYGEGTSWEYKNLTREQAEKKVNDCPDEYMAFMTPMDL